MQQEAEQNMDYYEWLADQLIKGEITSDQLKDLEAWYLQQPARDIDIPEKFAQSEQQHEQALLDKIRAHLKLGAKRKIMRRRVVMWTSVAAAVLVCVLVGNWWLKQFTLTDIQMDKPIVQGTDIAPGHQGAVLHLSNGTKVVLDSLQDGMVVQQGDTKIIKENGQLKYIGASDKIVYNDIVTDRGRQWKMVLPDGTEVWMNAASSLHYPISFKGQKERIVELKGEAYFKVAHNAAQPFKVMVGDRVIEDIGTEFNVNAYQDGPAGGSIEQPKVITTLVEGVVKVDHVQLKPGQQATVNRNGRLDIKEVNTKDFTAWVRGQLSLDNVTVKELMNQLSRWYDVDVVYKGAVPDIRLGGLIDRKVYLSDIISVLNAYGIHLELVGKTLIVAPQ